MVAPHDSGAAPRRWSAYRLQGPSGVLLRHLQDLGKATLILREQGLTLATRVSFDLFTRSAGGEWSLLRDPRHQLATNPDAGISFHLLEDPEDCCPLLIASVPGAQTDFTFRLEDCRWSSPGIRALLSACHATAVDPAQRRIRNAAAWLDDWAVAPPAARPRVLWHDFQDRLECCRLLEVSVTAGSHQFACCFTPAFYDTDGTVFRIADALCDHVVFADIADPSFRMETVGPFHLQIRRESYQSRDRVTMIHPAA